MDKDERSKMKKNKGKKKWFVVGIIVLFFSVVVIVGTIRYPQWIFLLEDTVAHLGGGEKPIKVSSNLEMQSVSLEQFLQEDEVTYNQSLMLINTEYLLSSEEVPKVSEYKDSGVYMNDCIQSAYETLSSYIKENFNTNLYVISAYRTAEEQQEQIDKRGEIAATVGASEHQQGLALDVYVKYYSGLGFLKSEVGRYVNSFCGEYGFIIRYPYYGKKYTGVGYEPWHIRYVGFPHSQIIMDNHITLEEYVSWYDYGEWYEYEDYLISRQEGDTWNVPSDFSEAVVSPDNEGGYWITLK